MRALPCLLVVCAACGGDPSDELRGLRDEVKDLRQDVRDLREDVRALRGGPSAAASPDPTTPATPPAGPLDGGAAPTVAIAAAMDAGAPRAVALRINSQPGGAAVYVADKLLGRTPMVYETERTDVELSIRIESPGYRPHVTSVRPTDDVNLNVRLARRGTREPVPKAGHDTLTDPFGGIE